jgi:hypothetical protein
MPAEYLTATSRVAEEAILEPSTARTRDREAPSAALDITCDVKPGRTAILALRLHQAR